MGKTEKQVIIMVIRFELKMVISFDDYSLYFGGLSMSKKFELLDEYC